MFNPIPGGLSFIRNVFGKGSSPAPESPAAQPTEADSVTLGEQDAVPSSLVGSAVLVDGVAVQQTHLSALQGFAAANGLDLGDVLARTHVSSDGFVTGLYLNDISVTDITQLSSLTTLRDLSLSNSPISDISPLSGLTQLESLYLHNTAVSDVGALSSLTNLEVLSLYKTQVSDISPLSSLTGLWRLSLGSTQISNVSPLDSLTNLEVLYLWDTQVSDVTPLASLTNLDELYLNNTLVSDVSPLDSLPLRHLNIDGSQVQDIEAYYLARAERDSGFIPLNIQAADVSAIEARLDQSERTALEEFASANGLTLQDVLARSLVDADGHVRGLYLQGMSISDVSDLAGLTSLRQLSLGDTSVSDIGPLAGLINLEVLYLYGTQVSDVSPLASLTNLDELYLNDTPVSDISRLEHLPLRHLNLANTAISLSQKAALIEGHPDLVIIDLE